MKNNAPCPCQNCPCALTCWWTCDELSAWAEDKTFAQVADAFIEAYNRAEKKQKRGLTKTA